MRPFDLYLANVRGQKVSGYYRYYAENLKEARDQFRKDRPDWDYLNLEILAAGWFE